MQVKTRITNFNVHQARLKLGCPLKMSVQWYYLRPFTEFIGKSHVELTREKLSSAVTKEAAQELKEKQQTNAPDGAAGIKVDGGEEQQVKKQPGSHSSRPPKPAAKKNSIGMHLCT